MEEFLLDPPLLSPESSQSGKRPLTVHEKALRDIGGYRVVNDTFPHAVIIPPTAEFFYVFAEAGDSRLEIGSGQAGATSTFVAFEDAPIGPYPIAPGQGISCYGAASTWCNFRFLGRRY